MRIVSSRLERLLLPLVVCLAVVGLAFPRPGRSVVAHNGINVALGVLVAAVGLGLPVSALTAARRQWKRVVVAIAIPAAALPLIAWGASRLVPSGPLRLGVLAAGVAPSEVAAVALAALAGGSAALTGAVLIGSTVLCVLLASPVLHLTAGDAAHFSSTSLLGTLVEVIAVPLAFGMFARSRAAGEQREQADVLSSLGASLAVLVLIWLVASEAHLDSSYLRAGLALLVFLVASAGLAAVLTARLPRETRISLLLPIAMRDFAVAAGIAGKAFGAAAAAPLGLYGIFVLVLGTAVAIRPRSAL